MPYRARIREDIGVYEERRWTHPDNSIEEALNDVSLTYTEIHAPEYHPDIERAIFRGVVELFGGTIEEEAQELALVPDRVY